MAKGYLKTIYRFQVAFILRSLAKKKIQNLDMALTIEEIRAVFFEKPIVLPRLGWIRVERGSADKEKHDMLQT
ncbi:hypothetical protein HMPREF2796_10225 [Eikenella sp. HMSC071B05]|nr:hypothetical protein HMPREF2796_10225 [Eikenella sp. HMSC071B05]OFO44327.1 hypothetical protein HMPREF3043_09900 [Eikenella sp. HMSC073A11]